MMRPVHLQHTGPSRRGLPSARALRLQVRATTTTAPPLTSSALACPYRTLGVEVGAEEKEVKRAYRRLALKHHPDISKAVDAERQFRGITAAYEMLINRHHGIDTPTESTQANNWGFHDWYWSFRMQRSWDRAASAAGSNDDSCNPTSGTHARRTPPPPGFSQPEARETLRTQLAGLRQRAAVKKVERARSANSAAAASGCTSSDEDCEVNFAAQQAAAAACSAQEEQQQPAHQANGGGEDCTDAARASGQTTSDEEDELDAAALDAAYEAFVQARREEAVATAARAAEAQAAILAPSQDNTQHAVGTTRPMGIKGVQPAGYKPIWDGHHGTPVANHAVPFHRSNSSGSLSGGSRSSSSDDLFSMAAAGHAHAPGPSSSADMAMSAMASQLAAASRRLSQGQLHQQPCRTTSAPAAEHHASFTATATSAASPIPTKPSPNRPDVIVSAAADAVAYAAEVGPEAAPLDEPLSQPCLKNDSDSTAASAASSDNLTDGAAEGAAAAGQAAPRKRFVASSDAREGISHQLTGLRRKAALRAHRAAPPSPSMA